VAWPKTTDFIEAVQNLRGCVEDEELRGGEVARTPLGLPMLWSGNFADVYKIHCPATGNTWAIKCFTRQVRGLQDRYRRVAAHLGRAKLPFTVDFRYLEQGIRIGGEWFPALKMRWVEGLTLAEFVEEHLERPGNLKMLLDLWVKLAARLREAQIAHADLQHGNVLLVPQEHGALALRLIDYDGMYVPSLAGTRSGEVGHPAYQHPQRLREGTYNAEVDRFSHLAIYTAIHCLKSGGQDLWRQFNNGDNLLFREQDFRSPADSQLFRALWNDLPDLDARALVGRTLLACRTRLEEAPLLGEVVADGKVLPLSSLEEAAVGSLFAPSAKFPTKSAPEDDIPLEWIMPPIGKRQAAQPATSNDVYQIADLPAGQAPPKVQPISPQTAEAETLLAAAVAPAPTAAVAPAVVDRVLATQPVAESNAVASAIVGRVSSGRLSAFSLLPAGWPFALFPASPGPRSNTGAVDPASGQPVADATPRVAVLPAAASGQANDEALLRIADARPRNATPPAGNQHPATRLFGLDLPTLDLLAGAVTKRQ
jgi:serine/threonine protein kinase